MISYINSWGKNIIVAVVIGTLIELIIPDGNNKKYIKTIIGIYIVFVIISPIINVVSNKNTNVNQIIENVTKQVKAYDEDSVTKINEMSYINEEYKEKIKEDVKKNLNEKGYELESFDVEIETEDENNYGKIYQINIKVSKLDENIKNIEEVKINLEESNAQVEENEEIDELKKYLKEEYDADNITISKEE